MPTTSEFVRLGVVAILAACGTEPPVQIRDVLAHPQRFTDTTLALKGRLSDPPVSLPSAVPMTVQLLMPVVVRYLVNDDSLPVVIAVREDTFSTARSVTLSGRLYSISALNGVVRAGPVLAVGSLGTLGWLP
jgi:hypothetical protein